MDDNLSHIDIKEYYQKTNKSAERKEAFNFFQDKYEKSPFDNYFIIEQTSRFVAKKVKKFLPGSIYTFQYPDPITKDELSYYDQHPMILVFGTFVAKTTGRLILQGVNMNFIPERQKVQLLDTYYRVFSKELLSAERDSDEGLIGQAKSLAKFLCDWALMTNVFVKQGKIPLTFTLRNYDISRIVNPVLVEIEDWCMIPFYVPRELQGISPAQVYSDYVDARKQVSSNVKVDKKKSDAIKKKFKKR